MRTMVTTLVILAGVSTAGCSPSCSPDIAEANPETILCPALHERLAACDFVPIITDAGSGYAVRLQHETSRRVVKMGAFGATVCEAERNAYRRAMAGLTGR